VSEVRTRRVGVPINGEQLERDLALLHLQGKDLAELAGVSEDTVSRARNGGRISRDSLYRISDALLKQPRVRNSVLARLVAKAGAIP
jgi:transcriptional regulator with XRE-family HTH domain